MLSSKFQQMPRSSSRGLSSFCLLCLRRYPLAPLQIMPLKRLTPALELHCWCLRKNNGGCSFQERPPLEGVRMLISETEEENRQNWCSEQTVLPCKRKTSGRRERGWRRKWHFRWHWCSRQWREPTFGTFRCFQLWRGDRRMPFFWGVGREKLPEYDDDDHSCSNIY